MCMQFDKLKDRVYDEFYSLFDSLESPVLDLPSNQDLYLIYHKVGTSRRFDRICLQENRAFSECRELLAFYPDTVFHVVRLSMALVGVAQFNSVNIDY